MMPNGITGLERIQKKSILFIWMLMHPKCTSDNLEHAVSVAGQIQRKGKPGYLSVPAWQNSEHAKIHPMLPGLQPGESKVFLSTPWRYMRGAEVYLLSFLTSATDRGKRFTLRPGRTTPKKERRYQLNRTLVGPQIRFGCFGENSFPPTGIRTPDRPEPSLVAIPTTLSGSCGTYILSEYTFSELHCTWNKFSHLTALGLQFSLYIVSDMYTKW
jgi:hypothetical protein